MRIVGGDLALQVKVGDRGDHVKNLVGGTVNFLRLLRGVGRVSPDKPGVAVNQAVAIGVAGRSVTEDAVSHIGGQLGWGRGKGRRRRVNHRHRLGGAGERCAAEAIIGGDAAA